MSLFSHILISILSLGGFQEGTEDGWGGVPGPSGFLQVLLAASS